LLAVLETPSELIHVTLPVMPVRSPRSQNWTGLALHPITTKLVDSATKTGPGLSIGRLVEVDVCNPVKGVVKDGAPSGLWVGVFTDFEGCADVRDAGWEIAVAVDVGDIGGCSSAYAFVRSSVPPGEMTPAWALSGSA
jgi:hypothetical protein